MSKAKKVILSYGMGVDSSALLVNWLENPESRDFDLKDLIVITAHVGDEFPDTGRLVEDHILPLLRKHKVRFVQVSRKGPSERDGIVVWDDSRSPEKLFMFAPEWTLSREMAESGTLPRMGGSHLCSVHFKGFPLDAWIKEEVDGEPFRHVIGFNAEELSRVEKDKSYSSSNKKTRSALAKLRHAEHPLVDWGWGRKKCEDFLEEWAGEPWKKSCCVFCPFAGGVENERVAYFERLAKYPGRAADSLLLEVASVGLNPRFPLYVTDSLDNRLSGSGVHGESLERLEELLEKKEWKLYRVRRGFCMGRDPAPAAEIKKAKAEGRKKPLGPFNPEKKGNAVRDLVEVVAGSREEVLEALEAKAREVGGEVERGPRGVGRVWVRRRLERFPCGEEVWAAIPGLPKDKQGGGFHKRWAECLAAVGEVARGANLELF